MAVHDMDILERLRRSVTKGHEPTDADALAAIAEIARLQLANKQSMAQADMRSAESCKLRQENERLTAALDSCVSWIDRWTDHVGNCEGGNKCTCGRTAVLYEANNVDEQRGSDG